MNVTDRAAKLRGVLAGACLYAFGALAPSALAQDGGDSPQPQPQEPQQPQPSDDAKKPSKKEIDEAIAKLPAWDAYGAGGEASMEETFFRLARDFVMTGDESVHPLGHVPVWPRGELKIAGFRVLPFLREGVRWDDNYYQQPNTGVASDVHGRQAEWTHENEIGVMADTALMGGRLGISTTIDSIWDIHYGHDAPPDQWNFEGQLGARYSWPSGVWISGGYRYNRNHDPADLPNGNSTDYGTRTHGAFFNVGFDRDIFFGSKLQFEFGVSTRDVKADDSVYSDVNRTETTVFGKASYPFLKNNTARLFVLVSEEFAKRDSEAINNGNTTSVNFGIEGSIPLREGEYRGLRGQVSVGFQHGLYENNTYQQGSQTLRADGNNRSDTTLQLLAALQYVMSPKTTTDLRYSRQAEFTTHGGNYSIIDRVDLSASHTFTRQLSGRVEVYYEHESPTGDAPAQAVTGTDISSSAPDINREGAGVGVRYAINEWLDVDLSANIENRNDHANSYKNYEGLLGLTFYLSALTPRTRVGSGL
jgi:hypothetical protein